MSDCNQIFHFVPQVETACPLMMQCDMLNSDKNVVRVNYLLQRIGQMLGMHGKIKCNHAYSK